MFTKRLPRNVVVALSGLFTLSVFIMITTVYIDNFSSLIGTKSQNSPNATLEIENDLRYHTVKIGETLADISKKYYGSPKYIDTIYEANVLLIPNKFSLEPGVSLIIPSFP